MVCMIWSQMKMLLIWLSSIGEIQVRSSPMLSSLSCFILFISFSSLNLFHLCCSSIIWPSHPFHMIPYIFYIPHSGSHRCYCSTYRSKLDDAMGNSGWYNCVYCKFGTHNISTNKQIKLEIRGISWFGRIIDELARPSFIYLQISCNHLDYIIHLFYFWRVLFLSIMESMSQLGKDESLRWAYHMILRTHEILYYRFSFSIHLLGGNSTHLEHVLNSIKYSWFCTVARRRTKIN